MHAAGRADLEPVPPAALTPSSHALPRVALSGQHRPRPRLARSTPFPLLLSRACRFTPLHWPPWTSNLSSRHRPPQSASPPPNARAEFAAPPSPISLSSRPPSLPPWSPPRAAAIPAQLELDRAVDSPHRPPPRLHKLSTGLPTVTRCSCSPRTPGSPSPPPESVSVPPSPCTRAAPVRRLAPLVSASPCD